MIKFEVRYIKISCDKNTNKREANLFLHQIELRNVFLLFKVTNILFDF